MINRLTIFLLLLPVLTGCASLPAPKTKTDSLLVIHVDLHNRINKTPFRHYQLYIAGIDEPVTLRATKPYNYVTSLPAGEYRFVSMLSLHNKGVRTREFDLDIAFTLKPGGLTLLDQQLLVRMVNKAGKSGTYQEWTWQRMDQEAKKSILDDLSTQNAYENWSVM